MEVRNVPVELESGVHTLREGGISNPSIFASGPSLVTPLCLV